MPSYNDSTKNYDAIVIGTGIAGMTAATDLNHRGHRVLVLELNHQPGGLMAGIQRKGFYFDVGCQSFENMNILFPLFEQYGLSDLFEFHRTRYRLKMPEFDTVVLSLKQAREEMKKSYPTLSAGVDRVFDMHELTSKLIQKVFVSKYIPYVQNEKDSSFVKWMSLVLPYAASLKTLMLDDFEDWYKKTLGPSGLCDLLSTCGYSRMNVFVASAFWHLWAEDYWYPYGGFQKMFSNWEKRLKERGVDFLYKSEVVNFEKKNKKIEAVITKKGERFTANQVVYTGDYKRAVKDLIGKEYFSQKTLSKLDVAKHSDPLISVYLGLNFPAHELKKILKSSHIFYFPTYDCRTEMDLNDPDAHKKVFLEVTAHCIEDESLNPEGKSSVVLQAFTRCEWAEHWTTKGAWSERSIEYKALKRKVSDEVITIFENIFPDVRKYIEYCDLGSPLTAYRFTRNELGGTCGFELNWKNFPFLNPLAHTQTPLENLHMAGHFTVWPGAVPTAGLSGKIAALRAHQKMKTKNFFKIKEKDYGNYRTTTPAP